MFDPHLPKIHIVGASISLRFAAQKLIFYVCVCAFFFQIPFSYEIHIHVIDGFNFNHFKPC